MSNAPKMKILDIIKGLHNAERMGSDVDDPEGSRYIQISETLMYQMVASLSLIESQRLKMHVMVSQLKAAIDTYEQVEH